MESDALLEYCAKHPGWDLLDELAELQGLLHG